MSFNEITSVTIPNFGILELKLNDKSVKDLEDIVNNIPNRDDERYNQYPLEDPERKITKIAYDAVDQYVKKWDIPANDRSTHRHKLGVHKLWVRINKPGDYVTLHHHQAVFSFVIWMKIPTDWRDEEKGFNMHPDASDFMFTYSDIMGQHHRSNFKLDKTKEGTMLFFPSDINHMVFPGYTSDEYRICIAGDLVWHSLYPDLSSEQNMYLLHEKEHYPFASYQERYLGQILEK